MNQRRRSKPSAARDPISGRTPALRRRVVLAVVGVSVAVGCSGDPDVVVTNIEPIRPTVVDAVPGSLDDTGAVAEAVTVAGLPVSRGENNEVGQSSLLVPEPRPSASAHVSTLIDTTGGLVVVGSHEVVGRSRQPTLWFAHRGDSGFTVEPGLELEVRSDDERTEAAAIDAAEFWNGDLMVLGREERPVSGSNLVVWSVNPDRTVEIEHRFAPDAISPDARRILVDDEDRTWIVSAGTQPEGALDVAVDATPDAKGGWVHATVPNGSGRHIRAAVLGDELFVLAAVGPTPESSTWVGRRFAVVDGHIVARDVELDDEIVAIQDFERIDGELTMLVVAADGSGSVRRSANAFDWEITGLPDRAGDAPIAVVQTDRGIVVLVTNPADEQGIALEVRSFLLTDDDAFEELSEPFVQIAWPPLGDFDFSAVGSGSEVVVLDRIPGSPLKMLSVSASGLAGHLVAIESPQPSSIERVDRLLGGPDGPIAIMSRLDLNAIGGTWRTDGLNRIAQLSDGIWTTVDTVSVHGATMWDGQPLLAVPAEGESTRWYTIDDGALAQVGSTDLFHVVGEMVTADGQVFASAAVGDDLHLFVGAPDGKMAPVDDLWGSHVAELCASQDHAYAIIESRSDTTRWIAEVSGDGSVRAIEGVPQRAANAGAPPQCVARRNSVGLIYEFDADQPYTALGAWWTDLESGESQRLANSTPLRSGRVLQAVSGESSSEMVGLALDRWDAFDAVWWTVDEYGAPVDRLVIGGPGVQEAHAILRVADGYLIGGVDDGEPVVWLIPN